MHRVERRQRGRLGPAGRGDPPAARVDRHDDPLSVLGERIVEQRAVRERRGPEHDPGDPCRDRVGDRSAAAQPTAELDREPGPRSDPLHVGEVGPAPRRARRRGRRRAAASPRGSPFPGGVQRRGVLRRAVEVALREAHGAPVEDVDRRVEDHARATPQPASSASPSWEDFSGWNCTPRNDPREITDAKRSPYSAVPSTSRSSSGTATKLCTW